MNLINNFLSEDKIILNKKVLNREEAIRLAAKPLLDNGDIKEEYVDDIINKMEELGPYMAIMPSVVIAHSRPGELVERDCISMMTLDEPVYFGNEDNDPIEIIFVIAAKENNSHLDVLQDLARVLIDEEAVNKIKEANNSKEVLDILSW